MDTIVFFCPDCGKRLSAPAEKAGTVARCAGCGAELEIPGAEEFAEVAVDEAAPAQAASPAPTVPALAIVSLVLGALGLLCFGLLAGLPAIICGHIAHGRIRRSAGALRGGGLAIAGFVLGYLSLLGTLVLVGTWAAMVPVSVRHSEQARITAARVHIAELETALAVFQLDTDRYPTTEEGLEALVEQPGNMVEWHGPYIERGIPSDPWGNPYVYRYPGQYSVSGFDLHSCGPDRQDGTEDDIGNWSTR